MIKTVIFSNSLYYKELAERSLRIYKPLENGKLTFPARREVYVTQKRAISEKQPKTGSKFPI